jgi:mannosyltransferase OCH1-like enzyme
MNSNIKIPKIIHQTWKNDNIPNFLKDFQFSWKKYNPEYEYRLWTDQDIDTFIKTKHNWFYPIFCRYNANIKRVDAFRYFLLYEFGGLYVDLDFECLKSFDSLIEKEKCFFGSEPPQHVKKWKVSGLLPCNALMASIPKHPFWKFVCHQLPKTANDNNIVKSTGPVFLRKCYYEWINKKEYLNKSSMHIKCFNHKYFYPSIDIVAFYKKNPNKFDNEHNKRLNNLYFDETFAVHHWSATYSSLKNKKRNYLTNLTNQKKNIKYPQILTEENLKKIYFYDDPDNQENIIKEINSQKINIKENIINENNNQKINIQKINSQEINIKENIINENNNEKINYNIKENIINENNNEKINSQEINSQEINSQEINIKENNNEKINSQEINIKENIINENNNEKINYNIKENNNEKINNQENNIKKGILKSVEINKINNEKKEVKNVIISDNNIYYTIPSNNILSNNIKKKVELKYPLNLFKKNNFISVKLRKNKKTISIMSKQLRYKR